jgi:hypothetical protein
VLHWQRGTSHEKCLSQGGTKCGSGTSPSCGLKCHHYDNEPKLKAALEIEVNCVVQHDSWVGQRGERR